MKTKRVLIIQEVIKHYRLPFYEALNKNLAGHDIELSVYYSPPTGEDLLKGDNAELPADYGKQVSCSRLGGGRLIYQHCLLDALKHDLVIVEQANRQLINYFLMAGSTLFRQRFAFWGHGRNFQSESHTRAEKFKRSLVNKPHWWFAYNTLSADYIRQCGFNPAKITDVENSIDTRELSADYDDCSAQQAASFKQALGIPDHAKVGIFCGSLYGHKQIPFMTEALLQIKQATPEFHFVFIGSGPGIELVESFCREHQWTSLAGNLFGKQKALAFRIADIVINPGLVGLGVLDSFATGTPMVTTDYPYHSPEIAYLKHDVNGVISPFDTQAYATTVVELLNDRDKLDTLAKACRSSAEYYSIERMADNFTRGIVMALETP